MSSINNLSPKQLRKAARLQEKIGKLQAKLAAIVGEKAEMGSTTVKYSAATPAPKKKREMRAAGKAKIVAAQKARWAKVHAAKGGMSAAAKAKMSAAAKARWAKVKAEGKTTQ